MRAHSVHWLGEFGVRNFYLFIWFVSTAVFFSPVAFADNTLLIRIHGENKWDLSAASRTSFESFLTAERESLLSKIPQLQFPEKFESIERGIFEYGIATRPEYKNRDVSCLFLARVAQNLKNMDDRAELDRITNSGQVCSPRDVLESERSAWTLSLAQFLWTRPWIPENETRLSLEQQIVTALGITNYQRPTIRILTAVDFDGYGYNRSPLDRQTIAGNPKLAEALQIAKNFTPNDPSSIGDLGPELAKMAKDHPTSVGDYVIQEPTIYITNNWAPEALVELLAHEYGHVLHDGIKTIFVDHGDWIGIADEPVHNEASAEAVAWQALCGVYATFPEIELFHILKLKLMSQFKRQDSHLMGASAFAPLFHYTCGKSRRHLFDFLAAPDLESFLAHQGSDALKIINRDSDMDLTLSWR